MNTIRNGSFIELFVTTFIVAAAFQVAMSVLGILLAVLSPGLFHMNGQAATSPVGAIGVLIFLLVFSLLVNATISVAGAGIVLGLRRFLPAKA
ncbi:hypothetical protein WEU32_09260 [Brevundimonas sp. BH3]|uniref:hypothetical protein n=1 Tax=Brevundimonas sp. BH3 TaxID=3133089 RepID=UPI003252ADE0